MSEDAFFAGLRGAKGLHTLLLRVSKPSYAQRLCKKSIRANLCG